jgi:hypothetical protein
MLLKRPAECIHLVPKTHLQEKALMAFNILISIAFERLWPEAIGLRLSSFHPWISIIQDRATFYDCGPDSAPGVIVLGIKDGEGGDQACDK